MRGLLAWLVLSAGCNYPEFGFVAEASVEAALDDGEAPDTSFDSADSAEDSALDSASDDTLVVDVAVDAPLDTAPPVGCVGGHVFCDDFEASPKPEAKWFPLYSAGGGTVTFDGSGTSRSPSHAPLSMVPSSGATDAPFELAGQLVKTFDAAASTTPMRLDFWVRVDAAFAGSSMMLAKLQRGTSGRGVEVGLGPDGMYLGLLGVGSSKYATTKKLPTPGKFVHVRVEASLVVGATGWGKVYLDDMTTPVAAASGYSTTDSTSVTAKVVVGLYTNETNPSSFRAYYDDVSFDWL